ncbi:hypothetical protein [Hyunsoonleella ulvae]|uniref:hypothetical protein n=1 Tax=Hyunsoonleella ulvae TaxID=2799948 RepID=UPI0019398EA1|nr:hypothetical protein [Hyunsoonleella ulvae]
MKKISFLILVMCCFLSTQCEDDIVLDIDNTCDDVVVVDDIAFDNIQSDSFQFVDVVIEGDCLHVTIGASGCDGNSWSYGLVDSGAVAESSPEQRFLKLEFLNPEVCTAFFERTISFNIASLQINGSNEIILNLNGWEPPLNYSY